jgi:magnesium chelatase family protein
MTVARVASRAQLGLHAHRVDVEVHPGSGLPIFSIVGLPQTAVKESKDRARAALANSGFEFPAGRITVNLSPADLPKEGCRYDSPIALGILLASSQAEFSDASFAAEFYGELGLTGEPPIKGVLLAAAHARRDHAAWWCRRRTSLRRSWPHGHTHGASCLRSGGFGARARPAPRIAAAETPAAPAPHAGPSQPLDLADVRGQAAPKRALLVAAAGAHSILLVGPPGTGKSMLAQRLSGLLPPLDADDALDVATIASVSGRGFEPADYGRRPFRSPHHSASASAIIGGGPYARPGEVSLAHRGVLFLDELPEFIARYSSAARAARKWGVAIARPRCRWNIRHAFSWSPR